MSAPSISTEKAVPPLSASDRAVSSEQVGDGHNGGKQPEHVGIADGEKDGSSALIGIPVQSELSDSAAFRSSAAAANELSYEEPAAEELLPPPDFKPFFTLVEDPETGEYHHPSVHYVFSDDDPELLTSTILATLEPRQTLEPTQPELEGEERVMILDMAPDGKTVRLATSLSPHWQALRTTVTQAPSWGGDAAEADRGPMLKILGRPLKKTGRARERKASTGALDDLVKTFGERLDELEEALDRRDDEDDDVHEGYDVHALD